MARPVNKAAERWRAKYTRHRERMNALPESEHEHQKEEHARDSIKDLAACLQAYAASANWSGDTPIEHFPKRIARWLFLQMKEMEAGTIPRYFKRASRPGGQNTNAYFMERCERVAVVYVRAGDPKGEAVRRAEITGTSGQYRIDRKTLNRWLAKHEGIDTLPAAAPELANMTLRGALIKCAAEYNELRKKNRGQRFGRKIAS